MTQAIESPSRIEPCLFDAIQTEVMDRIANLTAIAERLGHRLHPRTHQQSCQPRAGDELLLFEPAGKYSSTQPQQKKDDKERFIMTGSKMTTMTTEEMRAARERGESKTDWAFLRQNALDGIEPEDDEDSPDATALMRATIAKQRAGRPAGSGSKEQVAIRFDKDVLAAFRAAGPGWQTRMNAALKEWLKTHSPA